MSTLQIVVADRPPLVFVNNSTGTVVYTGMLIDLWQRIVAASNGTIGSYEYYMSPSNAGGVLTGGQWTGVVGELVYGRANVSLFPLTRVQFRMDVIDMSFSFLDQGLTLLVSNKVEQPGALSVLAPFETTLWVLILCTVVCVALLFWALDGYGRWIRRKQAKALQASGVISKRTADRIRHEEWSSMLISFAAAAGAPERPSRSSWGVQVLYIAYCFFCLIVLSAYTANLTSFLAVRRAAVNIGGLQDIVSRNLLLGVNKGSVTFEYFSTSQDTLAMQLGPHVRPCDASSCIDWVRQGKVDAYVGDASVLNYLAQQQPCDLATVGDPFGPGNLVVGLQKNSSLLPVINRVMQRFIEDGTMTSLRRAWFDDLSQCNQADSQLESSKLTISQMLGAFVFLGMGVTIAFITGTLENLKWCIARAYKSSNTESGRLEESHHGRDASVFNRLHAAVVRAQKKSLQPTDSLSYKISGAGGSGGPPCSVCGHRAPAGFPCDPGAAAAAAAAAAAGAAGSHMVSCEAPLDTGLRSASTGTLGSPRNKGANGTPSDLASAGGLAAGSDGNGGPTQYRAVQSARYVSSPTGRPSPMRPEQQHQQQQQHLQRHQHPQLPPPQQQQQRQDLLPAPQQTMRERAQSVLVSDALESGEPGPAALYGGSMPVPVPLLMPPRVVRAAAPAPVSVAAGPNPSDGMLRDVPLLETLSSLPPPAKPSPSAPGIATATPLAGESEAQEPHKRRRTQPGLTATAETAGREPQLPQPAALPLPRSPGQGQGQGASQAGDGWQGQQGLGAATAPSVPATFAELGGSKNGSSSGEGSVSARALFRPAAAAAAGAAGADMVAAAPQTAGGCLQANTGGGTSAAEEGRPRRTTSDTDAGSVDDAVARPRDVVLEPIADGDPSVSGTPSRRFRSKWREEASSPRAAGRGGGPWGPGLEAVVVVNSRTSPRTPPQPPTVRL